MKKIISFILGLFFCMAISAQQRVTYTMEGVVVDETGVTLPGVNVYLKEKVGVGTATDINGKFSIKASKGDMLVFTFVGYDNVELVVAEEKKDIKIQLSPASKQLDEVVVMGMGSKRKASQVASISTVDVSQLQVPTTSVANLMGGKIAGVITMQASGEPGKNIADFWVRGIGTFGYNSGALVLIDGLEGNINSIDPADIESFSVLKDASATAVYGVRGANGVVIITTKKGQSGKISITARANVSLSHLKRLPEYVGAYDYAQLVNEARIVRDDTRLYSNIELDIIKKGLDSDMYPDVNWQDEILKKNSWKQNYYVSARGGGDVARYFISLGGSNETAAYKVDKNSPYASNVGYNTYNYRLNLDLSLTPTTKVYFGSSGWLKIHNQPGAADTRNIWNAQSIINPLMLPVKYSTGELSVAPNGTISPYTLINHLGRRTDQEFTGQATMAVNQDLGFIIPGLTFAIQGSYDLTSYFKEQRIAHPSMFCADQRNANGELVMREVIRESPSVYSSSNDQYRKYYLKTTMNYSKSLGDHRISLLLNYELEDNKKASDAYDANQGLNANLRSIPKRYQALAGWINYSFKDTYLIDFNVGYTGTENFMPGRQYGWFPAVGLGWVPSNYEWVKDRLSFLDYLKLRGTVGSVGNDRISSRRFPYLTMVNSAYYYIFGGSRTYTVSETTSGADNLNWEQSIKYDFGFELRMFRDKVEVISAFFVDQRDGIFQERVQIPRYAGLTNNPYGNVGKMKSYGSDGTVKFMHDINRDMGFTIRANYTYSKNIVQNWEQVYPKYSYQERNGLPNDCIRGFKSLGFFKNEDDIRNSPLQSWNTVLPGDLKYMDVNGDGKIDGDDMVPLSDRDFPLLMYGMGGEFSYKNLTLGIMFRGTGKTDYYISRSYRDEDVEGIGYIPFRLGEYGNVLTTVNDPHNRWIPRWYAEAHGIDPALAENPNAEFPRLTYGDNLNNRQTSDFWKRDGRYFRLQEITVNYNWKSDFLRRIKIGSVDLQLIGTNLAVWSKTKMFDPEQAKFNGRVYPIPATYSFQIYVNF